MTEAAQIILIAAASVIMIAGIVIMAIIQLLPDRKRDEQLIDEQLIAEAERFREYHLNALREQD